MTDKEKVFNSIKTCISSKPAYDDNILKTL